MGKGKFALIGHPLDMQQYRDYIHFLKPEKTFKDKLLMKLFEWAPSYKLKEWQDVTFDGKIFADGIFIMVPFIPEMKDIHLKTVREKIEDSLKIAAENRCTSVALGAFTSIIFQGEEAELEKKYNISITSGNTNTAAIIGYSIEQLTEKMDLQLKDLAVCIIGASGDIGLGCLEYFGNRVKTLNLSARNFNSLKKVISEREEHFTAEINCHQQNSDAILNSQIVIFTTSAYDNLSSLSEFQPGTIICDSSTPANVKLDIEERDDVFLYRGGIATLPFEINVGFDIGLGSNFEFYGCMTEGLLTTIYPKLPKSVGRGYITLESINAYIDKINKINGLSCAYTLNQKTYTEERIKGFKKYANSYRQLQVEI